MKLSGKEQQRLRSRYGTWAVITGASSGIGREIALLLAEAGINLVIAGRDTARLHELAMACEAAHRVRVHSVEADVATASGVQEVIRASAEREVGLFVASAGYGTSGPWLASQAEQELNMLEVNCKAVLVLTHHYSKRFAAQKRGGIILLSSMIAFQGAPYMAHYAATKAYVQTLAEGLYRELKPHGVDVLAVAPGPVNTRFAQRAGLYMRMALAPEQVGVPVLAALGRSSTVFPGWLTKLLVYSLRLLPRRARIRAMQTAMGTMTGHEQA